MYSFFLKRKDTIKLNSTFHHRTIISRVIFPAEPDSLQFHDENLSVSLQCYGLLGLVSLVGVLAVGDGEHLHHELLLALASPLASLAAPASGPPAAGPGAELLGGLGRVLIINLSAYFR